ncbi:MAG: transposase [Candidatus Competibacteraceae bacterium]
MHAVTEALGYPRACVLTGGQASDIGAAERLIDPFPAEAVIGDQGYDSDAFVKVVAERSLEQTDPKSGRSRLLHTGFQPVVVELCTNVVARF